MKQELGEMRDFLTLWSGQVVSLLGAGLTSFALGVWVFQQTASVTKFSLIALFALVPGLLLSPLAGVLVDRWDRRRTLMLSNWLAAVMSAVLLVLVWDESKNLLTLWHIYALLSIVSCASALQWPALTAATTVLVSKQHYGRASGLAQMGMAVSPIVSPFLGGLLLQSVGMRGIFFIDLVSYGVAILTLAMVRFREPERAPQTGAPRSLWRESTVGWTYLRERPGLFGLLILFAGTNFNIGMLQSLLPPLVLSFASSSALGFVLSVGAVGMLAGTLVMGIWGGPKQRIHGILGGLLVQGLILLVGGWYPSVALLGTAAFVFLFTVPIVNACSQAIWQVKVPLSLQGRVFAIRRMVAVSSLPAAYLLAGPLADGVFEPMLAPGGALSGSVGALIGVGKGRGIGLLFVVLGVLVVLGLVFASSHPRLRNVEEELPDAASTEASSGTSSATDPQRQPDATAG